MHRQGAERALLAHAQIGGNVYVCAAATLRLVSHRYDEDILKC